MNSRVSWSTEGIDPSVRERAETAARRAGMSLSEWINSSIGEPAPTTFAGGTFAGGADQRPPMPARESRDVADIHQRLDSITRQIDQISRPIPRQEMPRQETPRQDMSRQDMSRGEPAVARQLNDAISRLDARLAQISSQPKNGENRQRQSDAVEEAAAQVYRQSPPLSPVSLDSAIAEIAARQSELDNPAPRQVAPRQAPPIAPAMPAAAMPAAAMPVATSPGPDFSSLERYLIKITSQIDAWRPDVIEQSIVAFRNELAEIRAALTEAMPRRAIESIENEIRSLSHRIDDNRQNGIDGQILSGIEHALNEIREALRSLTPAEQLTGYDEAIHKLGAKLDTILRSNDDPSTVQQLEGAIAGLRSIVSNIASNEALGRLSDDLHTLSAKVDQFAQAGGNNDAIAGLEQRIVAALTSSLEGRERPAAGEDPQHLESAMRVGPSRTAGIVSAGTARNLRGPSQRQSRPGRGRAAGHPAPPRKPAVKFPDVGGRRPGRGNAAGQRPCRHGQA
jgi:localization factor PodJL